MGLFAPLSPPTTGRAIVLVAQAAYHLDELVPLRRELLARGHSADLVAPIPPRKPLNRFRPGVQRHLELVRNPVLKNISGEPERLDDLVSRSEAIVVMNDWGVCRLLIERAVDTGRPTIGWVEGVQDFDDVDTGRERRVYRRVDHVMCLGQYGAERLAGTSRTVVGSERLRLLWELPVSSDPRASHVTINSNFTYGVYPEARRPWVKSAVGSCREADIDFDISRHSAERGLAFPHRVSSAPVSELLGRSSHLVTRFSTLGYEALVRGVAVVYHNPHHEQEPTFAPIAGALVRTSSRKDLCSALAINSSGHAVREAAKAFLQHHLELEAPVRPAQSAADVLEGFVR
ncbi:MAG: hypothetical protein P8L46_05565 [Acidimicrobiales bacterium]|nr:hypothetical protein [Acidimicrobiales bacterium]MDG2217495.1 hypothetical protein [Acidimicrobiales bacterium]